MLSDTIKASGYLNILHLAGNGDINSIDVNNLVVTTGKNFIISRMKDATATVMSHMALGTGVVAPANTDIALGTQLGSRIALTSTTVINNTITYVATFGPGVSTGNITEAGIFNASTSGIMLNRTVFAAVPKAAADTVVVTWTVTIQ